MTAWPATWVLFALLGAALLVVLLLALVVSAALRGGGKASTTLRLFGAESVRLSFRRAVKLIEQNLARASERYNLSWTLLLNDSTEQAVPLAASGLPSAFSTDTTMASAAQGIGWHFFDKGVVVQLRTNYLGPAEDDASVGGGVWDEFLTLCRNYRPERPFDAIVLAIPASALLDLGPDGEAALRARAQALHRRLWRAQNRLALRFPLHLMVTECETLPGFARFGAALPDPLRRAILGWASPFELVTPYLPQWVDSAMDQVVGAVADSCAELGAQVAPDADSTGWFLLPAELERLRAGMKLFCEELMRPSAYHESFLLRGIYLTGDSSPAAVLQASHGRALAVDGFVLEAADPLEPTPVFLRDIFERKVFPEVGLVRSSRQRMRRPAARRLGYWLALLMPLAWATGLVFATVRLHQLQADILAAVQWTDPIQPGSGNRPGLARSQRQASAALDHADLLAQHNFYAVAMPGSWPVFNRTFDHDLRALIEQRFAENAVAVLNASARFRIAQLTGATLVGGEAAARDVTVCDLPPDWPDQTKSSAAPGLNLKNLLEYKALMTFLGKVDDTSRAVQALLRLADSKGPPPASADLALAIGILLKFDPPRLSVGTAALYRAAAQGSLLDERWLAAAARCTVKLAGQALYTRLFDENTLMVAEKKIQTSIATLHRAAPRGNDYSAQLAPWETLNAAFDTEKALLEPGQGEWMHHAELTLGREQETLVKRVRANRLLGESAVQELEEQARAGHAAFRRDQGGTIGASGMQDGSGVGGLDWSEKGWAFTPQRSALAAAVGAMLAPPYMARVASMPLAAVEQDRTAQWDQAQLERAAFLVEARAGFLAGAYLRFPPDLQAPAGALVDAAVAAASTNALAQALGAGPQELPGAASDAQRGSVLRLRTALASLGAEPAAGAIDKVLVQDALTRLKYLDAYLIAAQLYMPGELAFDGWQGQKGAMADVFGGGDMAGLHAYVERQQDFIETSVAQADGVLTMLVSAGVQSPLVRRWRTLREDRRRYKLKSPTSTRLALETFILSGSLETSVQHCTGKQAQLVPDDIFSERLHALRASLTARCLALAGGGEQRLWQQFATAWNRDLAPRAPFAVLPDGAPGEPADRGAIGALMKLYDGAPVHRTNLQVQRMRALLAPLYPLDAAQAGGLDVAVEFRANPGAELRANQIIDWTLTIGRASLRLADPPKPLRWEPGMAVMLSLRLARDGAWTPRRDPAQGAMTIVGRTVNFRFDDPWALLSFINMYREAETAGDDGRAPLLRFDFDVMPVGASPTVSALDQPARVFLRLRVSPPGKQEALAWPARQPLALPTSLPAAQELVQGAL